MAINDQEKRDLYRSLIDVNCGTYEPGDLSTKQQTEAIYILRCRLAQYKTDDTAKDHFGPLQPAVVLSQISKVPTEVVQIIADDLGLVLPKEIVLSGEEEEDLEIMFEPDMEMFDCDFEEEEEDEFFNEGRPNGAIDFVEKILTMLKEGQIHAVTIAAVNNDGKASLWIPDSIEEDSIQDLFSPVIEAISVGPYKKPN